jgi:DNA-binding NarL/FixJ family response regulator
VLLLDVTRGRRAALLALSRLRRRSPSTRVILLAAGRPSDELLLKALERGARGCVAGRSIPRLLAKAVRAVDAGEAWLPRGMASQIRDRVVSLAAGAP